MSPTAGGPPRIPAIKICGLTRREDAIHAEQAGARFLGAILASGPRLLTPPRARAVLGPRRPGVQRVGVFGDQPEEALLTQADAIDLDVLQLHGERTADAVHRIRNGSGRTVWPVLRVAGRELPDEAVALADAAGALVLDAWVVGQLGGTGVALDWSGLTESLAHLRARVPAVTIVLAGGLRADNVATAIRLLRPDVVDVSSGVECAPGVKDPERVQQFVQAVRDTAEMP